LENKEKKLAGQVIDGGVRDSQHVVEGWGGLLSLGVSCLTIGGAVFLLSGK
jgi:hypothetical protein